MAAFGHFGCPKFTLDRISGHFRSIGHFGFQKLTNKIFLWTNDIVKTEHKQLKHGIHGRSFQRSFVTLHDCLFLVAMTIMCIFLYSVNIGN